MREQGRKGTRHAFASAVVCATVVAATATGCDATGGNSSAPLTTSGPSLRPSPSPTPQWNPAPATIAAVGDSITRGFDACELLQDCPEVSWATGTDPAVDSVAERLLGAQKAATGSWNYAKSGAAVADLTGQLEQAATHRPGLVTVMIGANDACRPDTAAMTSVADFRNSFSAALLRLRALSPDSYVYVASVPDLKRLWSQGKGDPLGRAVWQLGICASMLKDPEAVDAAAESRRDAVRERVVAYNSVLKEVCAKDLRCRYDDGAVFSYEFGTAQLSQLDYFHPSKDGQKQLAELAYRRITAAGAP